MRTVPLAALDLLLAIQPVLAQAPRRLGAHVHAVTAVDIGLEGNTLQVVLDAPAATRSLAVDIVLSQKQERQELGQAEFRVMFAP